MRHSRVAIVAGLCALALPVTDARAADSVVAHDTVISSVHAFQGRLVYKKRTGKNTGVWIRRVGGKLRRATRIPNGAHDVGEMGLDSKGRTVLHVSVSRRKNGLLVSVRHYIYDVASDRRRLLKGLPSGREVRKNGVVDLEGCYVNFVSFWRSRLAYQT